MKVSTFVAAVFMGTDSRGSGAFTRCFDMKQVEDFCISCGEDPEAQAFAPSADKLRRCSFDRAIGVISTTSDKGWFHRLVEGPDGAYAVVETEERKLVLVFADAITFDEPYEAAE